MPKCKECQEEFTDVGLQLHVGTHTCALNKKARKLTDQIRDEEDALIKARKVPIHATTARSFSMRKLEDVVGLVRAKTKVQKVWHPDGEDVVLVEEPWVDLWVYRFWEASKGDKSMKAFWRRLEDMVQFPEDQRTTARCLIEIEVGLNVI